MTPEQALAHPTWKMGKKITVDSATLMNKGYEVIEANMLYGTPYADIETVIQPQSIIHSLVEFTDGAVLAQLSYPTMLVPIQLALSYPKRLDLAVVNVITARLVVRRAAVYIIIHQLRIECTEFDGSFFDF